MPPNDLHPMTRLDYVKHTRLSLKGHPEFTEKWLQERIADDPSILRLPGQPSLLDRERRQERAGRLDLLLHDSEADRRFEVELMLGSLDESHIIRAIEYWDIERRRYPAYDHVAVLVAEDVTGRFLNILSLLSGTIPLIAMQCQALQVGDKLVVDFVKVLDQTSLRRDDEEEGETDAVTRDYWVDKVGNAIVTLCDQALATINAKASSSFELNYLKQYIGMTLDGRSRNFVLFLPKKKFVHVKASVSDVDAWVDRFAAAGLEADVGKGGRLRVTVSPEEFTNCGALFRELLTNAVEQYEG